MAREHPQRRPKKHMGLGCRTEHRRDRNPLEQHDRRVRFPRWKNVTLQTLLQGRYHHECAGAGDSDGARKWQNRYLYYKPGKWHRKIAVENVRERNAGTSRLNL